MANATKHALAGALLELLNTTTLDNITVKDIVERAQVSRQTFYYHFGDVYQLLDWAFQRAIRELGEMPEENWRDRLLMADTREENIKYIVEWDPSQRWRTEVKTVISRRMQRNLFRKE